MAVHKRSYKGYAGSLTPAWSRFLILFNYSRKRIFSSKFATFLYVICFFWPLICLAGIYLSNNLAFLARFTGRPRFLDINNVYFFWFNSVQGTAAFILTAFTGPGLVSPDLINGALPLYFCRPFSRTEYVLGKASVIAILLSSITWIPGLILFVVQATLAGSGWLSANIWIAGSLVLASWIWIAILCLLSLALSAWVRWKVLGAALLLGVFFIGSGFGAAINAIMRTDLGNLINIGELMGVVWTRLFRIHSHESPSTAQAWTALIAICAFCLFLLWRKIRAYEVVK
jgi:ABC-2 type transport system permease protein